MEEARGMFSSTMRLSTEQVIHHKRPIVENPGCQGRPSISSSRRRKHVFKAISHPLFAFNENLSQLLSRIEKLSTTMQNTPWLRMTYGVLSGQYGYSPDKAKISV